MIIAFASDYGHADEFVGVCKAVILGIAPSTTIVDLGHDIPPHDVRAGALLLVRAVQYLPEDTIVIAVVDPGVGTDRRLVAVEVDHGVLLGPDNGLLAPAVAMAGGARSVVELDNPEFHLEAPGPTFAGRDVLAPVAGYLASGTAIAEVGTPVDPATLVPGVVSLPEMRDDGSIACEVWWVDRFGNCQLNVDPDELPGGTPALGERVEVHIGSDVHVARRVHTYADAKPSELALVIDSYGLLSLAFDRASAAALLDLHTGSAVTLVAAREGSGRASPSTTPIEFSKRANR